MPSFRKDAVLTEAVDMAREALDALAPAEQIGAHLYVKADGDRLMTHRFAAQKPGYYGWEWFVTVARVPRSKHVTVCELGLLPGEDALLAPEWVPWSERVTKDEKKDSEEKADGEKSPEAGASAAGEPHATAE